MRIGQRRRGGKLRKIATVPWSESFGILYAHVTFLQGMVPLEHGNTRCTGMAPYAKGGPAARIADRLERIVRVRPVTASRCESAAATASAACAHIRSTLSKIFRREQLRLDHGGVLQLFTRQMLCGTSRACGALDRDPAAVPVSGACS